MREALNIHSDQLEPEELQHARKKYEGALARRNSVSRKICGGSTAVTVSDLSSCEDALKAASLAMEQITERQGTTRELRHA